MTSSTAIGHGWRRCRFQQSVRHDRIWRAGRFLAAHPDPAEWMGRPTRARLADLHRLRAWPFATWLFVTGRIRPDLELVAAKPGGVDLPAVWAAANAADVERVTASGVGMGWSENWIHQVAVLALSLVAVVAGKTLDELSDADFDRVISECERAAGITVSARACQILCVRADPCPAIDGSTDVFVGGLSSRAR